MLGRQTERIKHVQKLSKEKQRAKDTWERLANLARQVMMLCLTNAGKDGG